MPERFYDLITQMPYLTWLGISLALDEDGQPIGFLPYAPRLIGDSTLPALHGGVLSGFLEAMASVTLSWSVINGTAGRPGSPASAPAASALPRMISATTTFLRSGRPEDCHGSASIIRIGWRYASLHARVWQNQPARPITEAICHFRMPSLAKGEGELS